jgi:hypothetical protein
MPGIVCISGTNRPDNYTSRALRIVVDELRNSGVDPTVFDARALSLAFPGHPDTSAPSLSLAPCQGLACKKSLTTTAGAPTPIRKLCSEASDMPCSVSSRNMSVRSMCLREWSGAMLPPGRPLCRKIGVGLENPVSYPSSPGLTKACRRGGRRSTVPDSRGAEAWRGRAHMGERGRTLIGGDHHLTQNAQEPDLTCNTPLVVGHRALRLSGSPRPPGPAAPAAGRGRAPRRSSG